MHRIPRSWVLLYNFPRFASTAPPKIVLKPNSVKVAPKTQHQSHAQHVKSDGPQSDNFRGRYGGRFGQFFTHPRYRAWRTAILLIPVFGLTIIHLPYETMTVSGLSMSPFLNANSSDEPETKDRILVQRWLTTTQDNNRKSQVHPTAASDDQKVLQRGQVVIFSTPHRPSALAVKRIVAIPGDLVQPLPGYSGGDEPVVVPWNHVWVEGDFGQRSESMDSNWYGPISQNLIIGEVKAVRSSWLKWTWIDWRQHTWPARKQKRVEEDAIAEASVDPDAVSYSSGWQDGSIALILERTRQRPDSAIRAFVNDPKARQETRRLYNNAVYVAAIATSPQEKQLALDLLEEMEEVYGRDALVFGIRMSRRHRDRGELPKPGQSEDKDDSKKDLEASSAENWLKGQGWELERNSDGFVKTRTSGSA